MLKNVTLLLCILIQAGCIGSSLVMDDYDENVTYPSLHTVPDRPPLPDFQKLRQEETKLIQSQTKELEFNQEFRKNAK